MINISQKVFKEVEIYIARNRMSLRGFLRLTGMSSTAYYKWMRDETSPTLHKLQKICDDIGVKINIEIKKK